MFDLGPDGPESVRADHAGVAADDAAVDKIGDDKCHICAGANELAIERSRVQHTEQKVHVTANESVPVVVDWSKMDCSAKLDTCRVAGNMVVAADQAADPFR